MENTTGIITEIDKITVAENNAVILTDESLNGFGEWLHGEERSSGTIEKYLRDVRALRAWLDGREANGENIAEWKVYLMEQNYQPVTINSMLASVNTYCRFAGIDCKIKFLRLQRRLFRDEEKELTKAEYERLLSAARSGGKNRLELLLETIGSTGVRVSEVRYITVEAARNGKTQIALKGKIRVILLPKKLCRKLLDYAKRQKIIAGEIFITKSGRGLSRKQIWAEMKALCKAAGVAASKVFPHNLRHLFARVFYKMTKDVAKLSDLLGHSSIETTRIYLLASGEEHARQLEGLGLVQ